MLLHGKQTNKQDVNFKNNEFIEPYQILFRKAICQFYYSIYGTVNMKLLFAYNNNQSQLCDAKRSEMSEIEKGFERSSEKKTLQEPSREY